VPHFNAPARVIPCEHHDKLYLCRNWDCPTRCWKARDRIFSRLNTVPERDGQTDGIPLASRAVCIASNADTLQKRSSTFWGKVYPVRIFWPQNDLAPLLCFTWWPASRAWTGLDWTRSSSLLKVDDLAHELSDLEMTWLPWRPGAATDLHHIVFHFWPKLTHPAARSLCDSWATCSLSLSLFHAHSNRALV